MNLRSEQDITMDAQRFTAFPPEALKFLRALKRNNNREWFLAHKATYEENVKRPMEALVLALANDLEKIAPELVASPKASMYRIYRDTRFSKNKSPYKTHVAAVFPRKGLDKHQGAGLYLHVACDELLIGGGVYMPSPEDLNAIRRHVAENWSALRAIVEGRTFRQMFGELSGEQLVRVPRGFASGHPAADYLRRRQFLAAKRMDSAVAVSDTFYKTVLETFRGMMPLIRFLNEPVVRENNLRERHKAVMR